MLATIYDIEKRIYFNSRNPLKESPNSGRVATLKHVMFDCFGQSANLASWRVYNFKSIATFIREDIFVNRFEPNCS